MIRCDIIYGGDIIYYNLIVRDCDITYDNVIMYYDDIMYGWYS